LINLPPAEYLPAWFTGEDDEDDDEVEGVKPIAKRGADGVVLHGDTDNAVVGGYHRDIQLGITGVG
jgi:hypothetical protein